MRRILLVLAVPLVSVVVSATAVMAQELPPPLNPHNCGSDDCVNAIAILGSGQAFGDTVSDEAIQQEVDNQTDANCDKTPRKPPPSFREQPLSEGK
jgi:hypothetical protein